MDHKDLNAWKRAMLLVEEVYTVSAVFTGSELYGITPQSLLPISH
jgi:23S rRNA-intervening sequence protein